MKAWFVILYLLGLERAASKEDIDAAYFREINKYQKLPPGFLNEELNNLLNAYETLADEDSRKKYDQRYSDNIE